MEQWTSFGTLLKKVLDSTRSGLSSNKSISIAMLVQAMKDEIKASGSFWVAEVVRGPIYLQPMEPRAHYPVTNGEIKLHPMSGLQGLFIIRLYRRLSGPAGQYWEKLE